MKLAAEVLHNTRIKKYPNGKVHITVFSKDVYTRDGWEPSEDKLPDSTGYELVWNDDGTFSIVKIDKDKKKYNLQDPRSDSMRRAKGKIFDIALSNEWSYMVTLTLDKDKIDRFDSKAIIKPFSAWLRNMTYRKGLKYLIVPELHEDGAIHFHGLMNDVLDIEWNNMVKIPTYKDPIKLDTAKLYGYSLEDEDVRKVYNIKNWHLGWSTAIHIDDNVEAVSKYMTKYTCKNFQKIFGQSFFAGGDINRELPSDTFDFNFHNVDAETFYLPDGLGAVKYILVDEDVFDVLKKEWSI